MPHRRRVRSWRRPAIWISRLHALRCRVPAAIVRSLAGQWESSAETGVIGRAGLRHALIITCKQ
jgi:hypothetical protein